MTRVFTKLRHMTKGIVLNSHNRTVAGVSYPSAMKTCGSRSHSTSSALHYTIMHDGGGGKGMVGAGAERVMP